MFFVWHRLISIIVDGAPTVMLTGRHSSFDDALMTFARFNLFREPDDCSSSDEGFVFSFLIGRCVIVPADIVELRSDIGLCWI
jgi:hypothetical protein